MPSTPRRTLTADDLTDVIRAAFGPDQRITGVQRLRGGTKKGVYRVGLTGVPASAVVYSWADEENFWTPVGPSSDPGPSVSTQDPRDPFAPADGMPRFLDAVHTLQALGVPTLHVYLADDSRQVFPADVAVVADQAGGTLEALYDSDPAQGDAITRRLAETLQVVHAHRAPTYGTLEQLRLGIEPYGPTCEHLVLERALGDVAEAAGREPRIAAVAEQLARRLHDLHARISPRQEYALIHGELGPDHVLLTAEPANGAGAVLIDIEGLMFFDVEWEHVFLEIRFGERYRLLAPRTPLDGPRMDLYRLAMRLSLVAGPLRLLEGDFPDRAFARSIAEHNTHAALALLGQ
ncbi:aminoglycoside phosphotransferase [Kineosporia sp. NBRC 101677]|uniref:phosphotransferase family protein n=1 Tax=Kineosporia sp. NBRC 101677 TaxID=3032197 RepID=UPI0024A46DA1|nr:phosphotransferase [Kineosporia sp. NBRC 101677]GLY16461.1 aminoglycoside phosphotransferase [Kineosporia sp. NBRC 101677]